MPECDRSFLKDLKSLDKRLGVKWNSEHFVITYDRGHGEPVNILRVRGENGGFRQPDRRDLAIVKGGDLACGDKMTVRLQKAAYQAELIQRRKREHARQVIRDATKDDAIFLQQKLGQALNLSKSNSAFRRVTPKKSKNVVATA